MMLIGRVSEQLLSTEHQIDVHLFYFHYFQVEKSFWAEECGDDPPSLKQALCSASDSHKLLMKTKGFSRNVCSICHALDANAESIYNDLVLYLNATDDYGIAPHKHDKAIGPAEQQQIVMYLSVCSQDGITE